MAGKGYQELIAWQKAMDLTEAVYGATTGFPADERFGLTAQMRRAAVSIPSNIAEGHGRSSQRDFARFLEIAIGSVAEIETQLLLAGRLKYLPEERVLELLRAAAEVGRLLNGLLKSMH
ncbi:MAG: four helix bundle protein [Planctomycetaceae bacterium]|nr:four helix bundle protein [Planctomycetaceae bacterium]